MSQSQVHKVRRFFAVFLGLALLASIWPVYPWFSSIRPIVLGMPFSLFYLVAVLFYSFFGLLALYLWEDRKGELD